MTTPPERLRGESRAAPAADPTTRLPVLLGRSVRAKITALVVASTLAALLLTALALIVYTTGDYRRTQLADVRTQADLLARASAPALAFNDRNEAVQNLALLKARADIEQAALYGPDGRLFAAYAREGAPLALPQRAEGAGQRIEGDRLLLFHPVREGGQFLGTVYLESRHRLNERMVAYVSILAAVMAVALIAALALSAWLQRALTDPIERVSRAARAVVECNDFSVRAGKTSEDEIGALTDAFNHMLEEIDQRTKAVAESEQRFRTVADSAPVLMWMNDETGSVFANKAYLDFVGVSAQIDVRGDDWARYVHPEDRSGYIESWLRCTAAGSVFEREFRFRRRDGEYRWMRSIAVPRVTPEGTRLGYTGCTFDVHDARQSADALRLADRRKDEFLATLAHELRNPLAPVRNALYLMKSSAERPAVVAEARAMIERNVDQMVRLVDDLLDVSRITTGKLVLKRERADLRAVLAAAVEAAMPLLRERGHAVNVELPPAGLAINADATRLAQVFQNLLNNAAKFTPAGGQIDFSAAMGDSGTLVATVRDNGVGIAPQMRAAIFEMFVQADRSLERTSSGLGVGLSLARRLVELHGGTLEVKSDGAGRGSEFTVRIPGLAADPSTSR
ncbi:MAG: ATP-binding protein [Rubrivivax sp.]